MKSSRATANRTKTKTLLICLFFGIFGAHRFYCGKYISGAIYFLTNGIFGLGALVDLILIVTERFKGIEYKEKSATIPITINVGHGDNFDIDAYNHAVAKEVQRLKRKYDFSTVAGISKIPVPKKKCTEEPFSAAATIEAVLNKEATQHKRNGNMELAIACLRKANEIMPYSYYSYQEKDYLRLAEYLKQNRQFDEARECEKEIKEFFAKKPPRSIILGERFDDSDLLISNDSKFVCSECAKYTRRVFSEFGRDKRYPILPEYFKQNLPEHRRCIIRLFPFMEGVNSTIWDYSGDLVTWSNRPFVDERSEYDKIHFATVTAREEKEKQEDENDRRFYDWLRENCPDICPKSYSGFRRMKNMNSKNYQQIILATKGIDSTNIEIN